MKAISNALVIILVIVWIVSIGKCENLTRKYGHEFEEAKTQTNMLDECKTFKVLEYSDTYAVGYYVTVGRTGGAKLYFERANSQEAWQLSTWEAVWSKHGSADGVMWPYIR